MKIEESSSVETNDFRVMIYPSSRKFTAKESMDISQRLYDFLSGWKYHGKPVSSSFKIEKNQFIVICIDEEEVSPGGCALDSLSDFLKELDREYGFELLNRMKVSYVEQGETKTVGLLEFKRGLKEGSIPHDIEVYDFSKDTYLAYLSDFLLPLKRSWAQIYV
ncbi:hypothetical protein [Bergeyella cardium]|uniref:Uncharacterized protein n=1 Tax=Bergeyella cardium TaxID=1585976 RepID=A0A6P1QVV5_9FLAO|nr:hypothetical protein [Bergeyella cardium]QHN64961.1 hypothetical protein DBX24_03140 [Bergeyella cardium]WHE34274.1 hypothetical protein P8603_03165 [Bergeyella cardium]WHF60925.1 hypothetical protein O0R51_03160 [Bergeyella cardium]